MRTKTYIKKLLEKYPFVYSKISNLYVGLKRNWFLINRKIFQSSKLMIDVGGGQWRYKRFWKVLDYSVSVAPKNVRTHYAWNDKFIDYKHDLTKRKPFPFENNSVDFFYSDHTFEHLSNNDCEFAFKEMYRCLKPKGVVRISVPDADLLYKKYLEKNEVFFKLLRVNFDAEAFLLKGMNPKSESGYYHEDTPITEIFITSFAYAKRNESESSVRSKIKIMSKEKFFNSYIKNLKQDSSMHHINWFNSEKLKGMLIEVGFKNVYDSRAQESKFKEMRGKNFDLRPLWSVFVEGVK